jgi:hypothetical protein
MSRTTARWFSANPSKAWAEKFFLCYLPFFFALNAGKQIFGWLNAGNFWHIAQNVLMLAPLYLIPLFFRNETYLGRKWYQTYWFKMNLWIYIFAFIATYFFTEYFFDVLGMVYYFPQVTWYFDSSLLGSGEQRIPIGMYFNGAAFFVVYHTLAVIVLRRINTSSLNLSRINLGIYTQVIAVVAVAYFFAWAETRLVATDKNSPFFFYRDLPWMLQYGSIFYACYFVVSIPVVYQLDEGEFDNWPVSKVCISALAASMMVFILLDITSQCLSN